MNIKLLVDCHSFDHAIRQGITTYLTGLYQAAVQIDSPLEYYFASYHPEKLEPIFGRGRNIHYLQYTTENKYLRLISEIPHLIRRENLDYAHFQYIAPLRKCCREVITLHDILFCDFPEQFSWKYRFSKTLLFKRSVKRADILLTVSNYSRERIAELWKIPAEKIIVTPNAVSSEWLQPVHKTLLQQNAFPFKKYFLYVSRIEPRKNHVLLLRCWLEQKLWKRDIGLVFIGAPAEKSKELDSELANLPADAKKYSVLLSNVDHSELRKWYAGADLFIFPSLAEGFGIPPLEAGMSGIPCLCSNQTAMSDFNFFGNGLFDPRNPEELKMKIQAFLDGTLVLPESSKIQTIIRQRYDWRKSAEILLESICHNVTGSNQ